jgi:DNA-binding transcriptional regulator YdaS (Cro superfamily)
MSLPMLTHWRAAHGFTLSEAGRLFGVSGEQVCKYERGRRRIPPEKVPAISAITGIPRELLRPDVFRAVSRDEGERMLQAAS